MGDALSQYFPLSPRPLFQIAAAPASQTTTAMNTSTIKVGLTMLADIGYGLNSDTITHVGYYQSTMGAVSANGYKIGIQGISATTGNPDGTYLGGGTPASAQFTPSSGNNGNWVWVALDNSISINRGQEIALVIEAGSGYTASDSLTVSTSINAGTRAAFPVSQTATGGTWSKGTSTTHWLAYKSATQAYGYPTKAIITNKTYGNTVEAAIIFTMPTNFCSTYKIKGGHALMATGSTGAKVHVVSLYDLGNSPSNTVQGSPPLQATVSFDNDEMSTAGGNSRVLTFYFDNSALDTLTAGNYYAIGFQTTTGSDGTLSVMDVTTNTDFTAFSGGNNMQYGQRTNSAFANPQTSTTAFTLTNTSRPYVDLILEDMTAPAGGGGGAGPLIGGRLIG